MHLQKTKRFMEDCLAAKELDGYAVLASIGGKEAFITSDNVNEDTYFNIASVGKILVTTPLILRLIGEGKLSLTDTLDKFFEDVPEEKKPITVKQLLTHTSGIVRYPFPDEYIFLSNDDIAKEVLAYPLAFAPGTKYTYSCNGMVLLGFIIEKLYELPLDEAFETHLKPALGITRSRFNISRFEKNSLNCSHREHDKFYLVDDSNMLRMHGVAGNGGSFWTLADMRTFAKAVMAKSEALYPKELYELAEQNHTQGLEQSRGLGYALVDENYPHAGELFPMGSFGHEGYTGVCLHMNRELDLFAIVLTNATRKKNENLGFIKYFDCTGIHKLRADAQTAIKQDLQDQGLL